MESKRPAISIAFLCTRLMTNPLGTGVQWMESATPSSHLQEQQHRQRDGFKLRSRCCFSNDPARVDTQKWVVLSGFHRPLLAIVSTRPTHMDLQLDALLVSALPPRHRLVAVGRGISKGGIR